MKIGIIDADLISKDKHRFPNLASMKISAYHKSLGDEVSLVTSYDDIDDFDKIYLSKVFTDTVVPDSILNKSNVEYGGTGFYYDKAPKLPNEIEHIMPDYHLYDDWVQHMISLGGKKKEYKYYTDYSIGFLTRGCFRQCQFCVNRNYKSVFEHSELSEFLDNDRKKICLLDDNFLGCKNWKKLLLEVQDTGKPFQFKQGLDERILTDEKCELLFKSRYDGDYIFAFDDVNDAEIIENKLKLIRKYTDKRLKFYTFCGFDRNDEWDLEFWQQDLYDLFKRISILMRYNATPYIMRFNRYMESPYYGTYMTIAAWCNQPNIFWKMSYREFVVARDALIKKKSSCMRYLEQVENDMPELAELYFDMKFKNE